jgi:hypothetical protein
MRVDLDRGRFSKAASCEPIGDWRCGLRYEYVTIITCIAKLIDVATRFEIDSVALLLPRRLFGWSRAVAGTMDCPSPFPYNVYLHP